MPFHKTRWCTGHCMFSWHDGTGFLDWGSWADGLGFHGFDIFGVFGDWVGHAFSESEKTRKTNLGLE